MPSERCGTKENISFARVGWEEVQHSLIFRIDTYATNLIQCAQYDEFGREIVYTPITVLSDSLLPGKGQKGKNCGKIARIKVCDVCGYRAPLESSCYQPLCPSCWHKWRFRRAKEYLTKLEGFRRYIYANRGRNWKFAKFHHVVLSPPQNLEYPLLTEAKTSEKRRFFNRMVDEAKKIAEYVGFFDGGLLIFHPYRLKWKCPECGKLLEPDEFKEHLSKVHLKDKKDIEEIVRKVREQDDDPVNEGRKWREILKKDDWYDCIYFSPHFHVFGVANTIDGLVCRRAYEKTAWIVHRVTKGKTKISVGNLDDLARSLLYCLSHVGILVDDTTGKIIRTIRWFGDIAHFKTLNKRIEKEVLEALLRAQKRLKDAPEVKVGKTELICPRCGSKLRIVPLKRLSEEEREKILNESRNKDPPLRQSQGLPCPNGEAG